MDHLRALSDFQEQFLETTRRADLTTPVPWLAPWTLEQLVVHLARIHHWSAAQARRAQAVSLGRGPFDVPRLYAECATELRATLDELDPDARAWTLMDDGVPPSEPTGTVRFWHRRQAHETLVHLWDLRSAIGEHVEAPDAAWLDCLDEVVSVMHPRQLRLERIAPPAARVTFRPSDVDASLTLSGALSDAPEAVISGPARSLALLAWGRGVPEHDPLAGDGVEVEGDRALAAAVVGAGLTP